MLSLLVGRPGLGKTTFAIEIAARITRGWLEGDLYQHPATVLIASLEDAIANTLIPRLIVADADRERVQFVACRKQGESLDLTRHLPEIESMAGEYDARFLIIDPLVAAMPVSAGISSHKDQDVRSVLAPLASLSERRDAAVLTNMHFAKSAVDALMGVGGSVGFVGAARSLLVFGPDPRDQRGEDGPTRILGHRKCNVGLRMQSRECRVLGETVTADSGDAIATSRVYIGDQVDVSADALVKAPDRKVSPRVQAETFLRHVLADGPMKATEVFSLAEDEGISDKTLRRAKSDLGVNVFRAENVWWWELPKDDDELPFDDDEPEDDSE
jgi:putative DNA primase/helicase